MYANNYYKNNKRAVLERAKKRSSTYENKKKRENYYKKNRSLILKKARDRYKTPQLQEYRKKWRIENKEKIKEQVRIYMLRKKKNDVNFKIAVNLRRRLNHAIKAKTDRKKWTSALKLLGCSIEELKKYLSKRFHKGMTWNNYGKWHIDHIKPLAKFNLSKIDQQKKAFNFRNLQPLWALDNQKKNKY